MARDANAGGVTNKGDTFGGIEVRDVMRSVARGVQDTQFPRAKRQSFAAMNDVQVILRDRKKITEESLHRAAIQTLRAGQQQLGIRHVSGAARVNIDFQKRIFFYKGTSSPGMVKMDVSEEDCLEVRDQQAVKSELLTQGLQSRSGAGINKSTSAVAAKQSRGDGARPSLPVQIEWEC